MKTFENIDQILDFAINAEQEAVDFYNNLAQTANIRAMKQVFEGFAQEEMSHKAKLLQIKSTGMMPIKENVSISDLKIADYTVTPKIEKSQMTYQEALVLAMNKEKAAFKLYLKLSEMVKEESLKQLFLMLAQEESKHKLRFELEYDELVLKEN